MLVCVYFISSLAISRIRGFRALQWVRLAKLDALRFRLSTDLVLLDSFAASHPSGVRICFQKVGVAGRGHEDPLRVHALIAEAHPLNAIYVHIDANWGLHRFPAAKPLYAFQLSHILQQLAVN